MQRNKAERPSAKEILEMLSSNEIPKEPNNNINPSKKTKKKAEPESSKFPKFLLIGLVAIGVAAICYVALSKMPSESNGKEKSYIQEVDTFTINGIHLEMVKIPGGNFTMGTNEATADKFEKPAQQRKVSDFYIGKYEVTQKLWFVIMNNNPSTFINDNYPVNNVSWEDCQLFIQRLNSITGRNFRLPTETEWEYAAKTKLENNGSLSATSEKYAGTSFSPNEYAWYSENSDNKIHPVGMKKPNAFGLYDMSGNVIEWCQDIFTNYATGNVEIDKDQRVIRGGFYGSDASAIRCTSRGSCKYNDALAPLGFRLCLQ